MDLPPILFLGGKGGVGKTTLAAALGSALANGGADALVASTDPAHSLGDVLEQRLRSQPTSVAPRLQALELDPEQALAEYLERVRDNLRRFAPTELLPEAERQVALAGQHPGALESALFEAICQLVDGHQRWRHLIFDTAPTGHTLGLLALPGQMRNWTDALLASRRGTSGPAAASDLRWQRLEQTLRERRDLFERVATTLLDPRRCGFLFVYNDEPLSRSESERAVRRLRDIGIAVPCCICNRRGRKPPAPLAGLPLASLPALDPPPMGLAPLTRLGEELRVQLANLP